MPDDKPADWVAQWRQGDQAAAGELYRLYVDRLIALARSQLSARLAQRVDAEDVVQSAYRCFFAFAKEGRYDVERGGDLWRLLVTVTLHKLQQHIERQRAQKRSLDREESFGSEDSLLGLQAHVTARDPAPADAVALTDELEKALRAYATEERRMIEMRLQGYQLEEIASALECSERTVRRVLERFKKQLASG